MKRSFGRCLSIEKSLVASVQSIVFAAVTITKRGLDVTSLQTAGEEENFGYRRYENYMSCM